MTRLHECSMLSHAEKRPGKDLLGGRRAGGLNVNDLIRDVMQAMQGTVEKKVKLQAIPADRDVRVMADREDMGRALETLVAYGSEIIRKGGTVTMLVKMLPIENALLKSSGGGCALLSVSSKDVDRSCSGANHMARKSLRRAFRVIRSVILGYNGSVRVLRQQGSAAFNIYLPVLRET